MWTNIIIIYIGASLCAGVVLGFIAKRDGGSFVKWFLYGVLVPFIALPKAISIMGRGRGYKKCIYCRKKVKYTATHCPKCGYEFIDW